MKEITRQGCGVPDCIYNELFRCTKKTIMVDEGSKCHSLKRENENQVGAQK